MARSSTDEQFIIQRREKLVLVELDTFPCCNVLILLLFHSKRNLVVTYLVVLTEGLQGCWLFDEEVHEQSCE